MTFTNTLIAVPLLLLAICIAVWPTQWISDEQNRWLRIVAVAAVIVQMIADRPRWQLLPAYAVAVLFAILLKWGPGTDGQPSSVRESREGGKKKLARWTLVLGSAAAVIVSAALMFSVR